MRNGQALRFSGEVEHYRRALVHFAQIGDWPAFTSRAGWLFDYIETVESAERERKFLQIVASILAVITAGVLAVAGVEPGGHSDWPRYRNMLILAALAGSSFELYFFISFRNDVCQRTLSCAKRKDAFLQFLERDFRTMVRTRPVGALRRPRGSAAAAELRSAC